jgi:hypothetical protein
MRKHLVLMKYPQDNERVAVIDPVYGPDKALDVDGWSYLLAMINVDDVARMYGATVAKRLFESDSGSIKIVIPEPEVLEE